jgi:hypothetical protein
MQAKSGLKDNRQILRTWAGQIFGNGNNKSKLDSEKLKRDRIE